jgi:NAD(P)-dependent dehydrogenase (short-subunit alcohol dehydrogenase family)
MKLGLKGKKAIVTGGATGIGEAICLALANEGVQVALTSRHPERVNRTIAKLGGREQGHYGVVSDITREGEPRRIADEVLKEFGEPNIVVNNVGDTLGITDALCPISDWRRVFRLNLEVHVEMNNCFIPLMQKRKWGRIVNISAGASMENSGPVPYCSIKAAYTAYSRSMGRVLAPDGIVMSAVLPGVVFTEDGHWAKVIKERPEHAEKYLAERTVLKRFGQPEEISPMVVLLCSELASFCVGSIVPVEGGQARHYFHFDGVGNG